MGCVVSYESLHVCRHDSVVEVSVWAQEQRFLLHPLMHVPFDETLMSFKLDFWGCFRLTGLFCGLTNQNYFWCRHLWDGADRQPGMISLHDAFCSHDWLCVSAHGTVNLLLSEEPINADTSMQVLESHKSPSDDVFGSEGLSLWTSTPV